MQAELDALRTAGIDFEVDEDALARRELQISFVHTVDRTEVRGRAIYPDLFPSFRIAVTAAPLGLTHHQNPLGGSLCLLGRGGDQWRPSYTLAWLLTERLPLVLASGREDPAAEAIALEDVQAEPFSAYVNYEENTAVLVDGEWNIPAGLRWGRLVIGTRERSLPAKQIRGAILSVADPDGNVFAEADPRLGALYPHKHHGRWARADQTQPQQIVETAIAEIPGLARSSWPSITFPRGSLRLLGIVIPEEIAHRTSGEGWIFVAETEEEVGKKARRGKRGTRKGRYVARPLYAGPEDLALRVPDLAPLRKKTVAVIGLGTLGAPAAIEFARAGVKELRVLDGDFVDTGPVVRWPFGMAAVGLQKTEVIASYVRDNYPYTSVSTHRVRLGDPGDGTRKSDLRVLSEMIEGADLIFDATADLGVQRMLAERAREDGVPYVSVVARHGAWGGVVFRQIPGRVQGCWYCLQNALQDGGVIPDAPSADPGGVQPRGCGDVTFTGTGFDMGMIALAGVRRAIGTLCGGGGGYPDQDGDVAVITLRNEDGSPSDPSWRTHKLPPDPKCDCSATES